MEPQRLIFLGGTAGRNPWRKEFIRRLVERGVPRERLFDPVVEDWNEAARRREDEVKEHAALLVFYFGDPQEPGIPVSAFSLVEAAIAVCRDPRRSLLVFELAGIEAHARKVYEQSEALLRKEDASVPIFRGLEPAIDWIAARYAGTPRTG
jgi:hypothetical protein